MLRVGESEADDIAGWRAAGGSGHEAAPVTPRVPGVIEEAAGTTRPDFGAIRSHGTEQGRCSVLLEGLSVFTFCAGIVRTDLKARRIGGRFRICHHVDSLPSNALIEGALQTATGGDRPTGGRRGTSQHSTSQRLRTVRSCRDGEGGGTSRGGDSRFGPAHRSQSIILTRGLLYRLVLLLTCIQILSFRFLLGGLSLYRDHLGNRAILHVRRQIAGGLLLVEGGRRRRRELFVGHVLLLPLVR